ncbi:MAG TPA: NAD(P)-dependent oxidoreductase [bacterium]|nr:NAD(P)-dependent oxidoreductase [bacterium]
MLLHLALNAVGLPALAVGSDPAGMPALRQLAAAGARVKIVAPEISPDIKALAVEDPEHLDCWEDDYSRHYLTPRPVVIVLMTADTALAELVRRDAHHRGILLVDVGSGGVGRGEGTLLGT